MNIKLQLGMRTLKTLIAVAICILSLALLGQDSPFFACIATIFVIQDDKDGSIANAKNRVWGTFYAAIISNIFLFALSFLPYNAYVQTLVTCLSIFVLIQVSTYLNKPRAIFPGCIVLCAILCTTTNIQTPVLYGIRRTLHTLYGALVGLGVNLYIYPYNKSKESEEEQISLDLHSQVSLDNN